MRLTIIVDDDEKPRRIRYTDREGTVPPNYYNEVVKDEPTPSKKRRISKRGKK